MTKIRHAYSPSDRSTDFETVGKSATRQEFKEECDINVVVDRHLKIGGVITPQEFSEEMVVLPDNFDYHEALNAVIAADEAFGQLPADIRSAHDNDAGKFLKFTDSKDFVEGRLDIYGASIAPTAAAEPALEASEKPTPQE